MKIPQGVDVRPRKQKEKMPGTGSSSQNVPMESFTSAPKPAAKTISSSKRRAIDDLMAEGNSKATNSNFHC
jgi:hypothetical protein